jgi:hypothetical protein
MAYFALANKAKSPMTIAENNDAAPEALQLSIHAKSGPLLARLRLPPAQSASIVVEWK